MRSSCSLRERGAVADGGAKEVEEVDGGSAGERNEGAGGEVVRQLLGDFAIDGFFGEGLVAEELFEGLKSFVAVGGPEEEELFQGGGAVRGAVG
jgi:hypothetical protein